MQASSNLAKANAVVSEFRRSIRSADSLAAKPKMKTLPHVTDAVHHTRVMASIGISDILASARAEGLMRDPELRRRFQRISETLNSF